MSSVSTAGSLILTELKRRALCKLPNTREQPRRHLLAAPVDALLHALAHRLLNGCLDLGAARGVLVRNGNGEQCCLRSREGKAGV